MSKLTKEEFIRIEQYSYEYYYNLVKNRLEGRSENFNRYFNNYFNTFLKYISMASIVPNTQLPVCSEVDDIWHEFILQTREYQEFCLDYLPGRVFIHHSSISKETYQSEKSIDDNNFFVEQMNWLGHHYHFFGSFEETELLHWKCTNFLSNFREMSIIEINTLASDIADEIY